jgi:hypothetical protein
MCGPQSEWGYGWEKKEKERAEGTGKARDLLLAECASIAFLISDHIVIVPEMVSRQKRLPS